jgi:hypothetical protein
MRPSYDSPSGTAADSANAAGPDKSLRRNKSRNATSPLAYVG